MRYFLAPFSWQEDAWTAPEAARALFDLRPLPARATPITPEGYGLFAATTAIDGAIDLGDSLTALDNKAACESVFGSLSANSIRGLVLEMLTVKSDPTGQDAPKPLMPSADLRYSIIFGDETFDLPRLENAAWLKVLATIREDYRAIRQWDLEHDSDHYRQVLGALKRKFRVSDEGIFIPDDLPQESALEPQTTVGDTFDRADNADINASNAGKTLNGSAATWQWASVAGAAQIASNSLRNTSSSNIDVNLRAEQDLSSADQVISGTNFSTAAATNVFGFAARYSAAADTYYRGRTTYTAGAGSAIASVIAGVVTTLSTHPASSAASGEAMLFTVNGSSLVLRVTGVNVISITDTAISGYLRSGIFTRAGGSNRCGFAIWQVDDITPPPASTGSLTVTLGAMTLSATGTHGALPSRTGTLNVTLKAATLAATGTHGALPGRTGTLTVTLKAATLAATGSLTTTGGGAGQWWMAAGVTPIAAYQAVAVANEAASYINLANPGVNDLVVSNAPIFFRTGGWLFNGSSNYLTVPVTLGPSNWSAIVRYVGRRSASAFLFGSRPSSTIDNFGINAATASVQFRHGNTTTTLSLSTSATGGIAAIAATTAWFDGVQVAGVLPNDANTTTSPLAIGAINTNGTIASFLNGKILAFAIFDRDVSAGIVALTTAMAGLGQQVATGQIVFDGNSMTGGSSTYPATVMPTFPSMTSTNVGVPGQTTPDMLSDAVTQVDPLYNGTLANNVLVCWEGTNDLKLGATAASAYSSLVTYCSNRRAAGYKVVIVTLLPRNDGGTPGTFEADRQTVNTNIRANWTTFADALADVAAIGAIGDFGDSNNATYYQDNVHMTALGYDIVAYCVCDGIAAVLRVGAHANITLAPMTLAATGVHGALPTGTGSLNITLRAATLVATGTHGALPSEATVVARGVVYGPAATGIIYGS